jgi:ornithine carbamoyltransferase
MEVVLAHPKGYEIMPDIEKIAQENAKGTGGSFRKVSTMAEASKMLT